MICLKQLFYFAHCFMDQESEKDAAAQFSLSFSCGCGQMLARSAVI